jgi:hypothetical protein
MDGLKRLLKITAHALPSGPANLSFDDVPGDSKTSRARSLVALVTDAFGNPVPDARVTFATKSGSVSPSRAVTDAKGHVKVKWTPGGKPSEALTGAVQGTDVRGSFLLQPQGGVVQAGHPATPPKATPQKATPPTTAPPKFAPKEPTTKPKTGARPAPTPTAPKTAKPTKKRS